jgi:hypothetical protein
MPSIEVAAISAALTADGDATGYATVASTTGFFAGCLGFIRNATTAKRIVITEIKSATQLGVRFIADDNEQQAALQVYGGRSNLTGFTTASTSRIYQESQLARIDPQWVARQTPNI